MAPASPLEIVLGTRRETRRLGGRIADAMTPGMLVMLDGDLGAGKTFLARAVLRGLGVPERAPVQSPTFTLVNEYEVDKGLVLHADVYRLREAATLERELGRLGLAEQRREGALVIVEWGAGAEALLGGPAELSVHLSPGTAGRVARLTGALAQLVAAGPT